MAYSKKHAVSNKSRRKDLDLTRDDLCFYLEDISIASSIQNSNPLNLVTRKTNKRSKDLQCVPKHEVRTSSTEFVNVTIIFNVIEDESVTATENQEIILKRIWKFVTGTSKNQLEDRMRNYFQEFQDYYWSLLKMLKSWDNHSSTTRVENPLYLKICNIIFDVFQELTVTIEPPSPAVQLASFTLICKIRVENEHLLQKIRNIFHYDSNPALFVNPIKAMIKGRRYNLTAQWIRILQLHEQFQSSDIAFPLLLQEKMWQVKNYLEGLRETSKIKFVLFCDSYCQNRKLISYMKLNKIPEIKVTKPRQLAKLINRLCIDFNISTDGLPNLKKWKRIFAVDSLIHDQYRKNVFHKDDWEEFLRNTTKDDLQLQLETLSLIVNVYEDVRRAYKFCKAWRMKKSTLPIDLVEKIKSGRGKTLIDFKMPVSSKTMDNSLHEPIFNKLDIVWVDNTLDYYRFIKYLNEINFVGLNIERVPKFLPDEMTKTSIMQIALADRVYLLDLILLKSALSKSEWKLLCDKLFTNLSITKIVFSFDDKWNDVKEMCFMDFDVDINYLSNSFIDLQKLNKAIIKKWPDLFIPSIILNNEKEITDFSNLVTQYMNLSLNDREQKSNWEKRPLRDTQVQFAALNAFYLLEVFEEIKKRISEKPEEDFQQLIKSSQLQLK